MCRVFLVGHGCFLVLQSGVCACYFSLFVSFCYFLLSLFVSFAIVFFLLLLWVSCFCISEHGHAYLWFGVLFFCLLSHMFFLIFVDSFCLGSIGVEIKVNIKTNIVGLWLTQIPPICMYD